MLKLLLGWKGYALVGLLSAAVSGAGGYTLAWKLQDGNLAALRASHAKEREAAQKAAREAVERARTEERKAAQISQDAGTKAAEAQIQIQYVTRTLLREVPRYVSPAADARCVVPVGFVRLHDQAASGDRGPPGVPRPAGESDDAASGLGLSAVAPVIVENYGAYHEVADRLSRLQQWVRDQQALAGKPQ